MNRASPHHQSGFGVIAWTALVFLYAPILVLALFSLNGGGMFHKWEGFSLEWYAKALTHPGFRDAAINTLTIAVAATVLATLLALAAAIALQEARGRAAGWALLLLGLPLVVPEVVMAIATLIFFSQVRIFNLGLGNLILAHTTFCLPFAMMPIRACLRSIDGSLSLAACDLHARPWQVHAHVTLPLLAPGSASGAALAFIVSFDDFAMSQFVAGPGQTTLPVFIWAQLRRPLTPEINAMCTIVLIVSVTFICLAMGLLGRRGRRLI